MFAGGDQTSILGRVSLFFSPGNAPYLVLYALLVLMFTYFYTAVQFNPIEHADNLKKSGGEIPGGSSGAAKAGYFYNPLTPGKPLCAGFFSGREGMSDVFSHP